MAKEFNVPSIYRSEIIRTIKEKTQILDPRKKDLKPSILDLKSIQFYIPRHFGFCYGVQNAIDIAYKTIEEEKGKRIFLLSEMIHNPDVNQDLHEKGVEFLFETDGTSRIPLESLSSDDIVIVPAFGTTVEQQKELEELGINPYQYDTTCPFVEKVWKRGKQIGKKGFNIVIHGKYKHEETRATFSHAATHSNVVVVYNIEEAKILAECMLGTRSKEDFEHYFGHKCTPDFDPQTDLEHYGVINQTTMLATETEEVMRILKEASIQKYGDKDLKNHFADTSDTLCYATNENQSATLALREEELDIALVVGGYNSSNTMHIVELLEERFPTFHIKNASEISTLDTIQHFDQWEKEIKQTQNWFPSLNRPIKIGITSGASCPDVLIDEVIIKLNNLNPNSGSIEAAMQQFQD